MNSRIVVRWRTACTLLALPLVGMLSACTSLMTSFGGAMPETLRTQSVAAEALVLEVWDTGWTVNDDPVVGMKVRVQPADGPAYEATIEKTLVSRIATWQFQPGTTIPVRYDPQNPAVVAVDTEPRAAQASSGNPYRDSYEGVTQIGVGLLPPPDEPLVYLGTGDSAGDRQALYARNYTVLGGSVVVGGADLAQAVDQGKEVGAALILVYGSFVTPDGMSLEVLPYRPRPHSIREGSYGEQAPPLLPGPVADGRVALYWGKSKPPILGVVFHANVANVGEPGRRLVVEAVTDDSPAAIAGIAPGDALVAIDSEPIGDVLGIPALLRSKAGQSVPFDLIRAGEPLSLTVDLAPDPGTQ
ncbi:MAG: PDZ domain-containing protein [Thermoanaerobaculia bacterium]